MKTKIIAIGLRIKLLNNYESDINSFREIDIPNLSYYDFPTIEFTSSLEKAEALHDNPKIINLHTLTEYFLKELKQATRIDIGECREQKWDELYPVTSHYHLARIYLGVVFQHIIHFKKAINFEDVATIISTLNDWYTKEMGKITPEMSNEQIQIKLALCLVRKTNLFARGLADMFPKEMGNYPLITKPLPNAFL